MKSTHTLRILAAVAMLGIALGLASCQNENDWAMNKGASPEYVPLAVSKKVYR